MGWNKRTARKSKGGKIVILDLNKEFDRERFRARSEFLLSKRRVVELTEKTGKTISQNNYLFLLLNIFSMEYGENVEFIKQRFFKELWNPDIFVRKKYDMILGEITYLRSITDLTKEETVTAIDRFKLSSLKEAGIFLPDAISKDEQLELLRQIDMQKKYL